MKLDLQKISDDENCLVKESVQNHGVSYENAYHLTSFFYNFIDKLAEENFAFIAFMALARKSILLSLLSILRKHDIQCQLMMRQFLEASVLAAFALENKNFKTFGYQTEDGLLEIDEKAKGKAYKWIDENYKDISQKIVFMKNTINTQSSHANIVAAVNNASESDSVYDISQAHIIKQRLWWIGNVIIGILSLLIKVNEKNRGFIVKGDFNDKYKKLSIQNETVKQELKPAFGKWLNKG